MLCNACMSVQETKKVEPEEFGQASEKLLLGIAMESSLEELNQMVKPRPKPVNLPVYYRSLQTWRSPVLHKIED